MLIGYLGINTYAIGIPLIFVMIILTLYIQIIIKRRMNAKALEGSREVAGYFLTTVGTFYAVLMGLVVVDAMSNFRETEETVEKEVTSLVKIYIAAERFPQYQAHIQEIVLDYTKEVMDIEFPMMNHQGSIDEKATILALSLLDTVQKIEPTTENQKSVYQNLLSDASEFIVSRRDRVMATDFKEPVIEWVFLIMGAFATIILTFFFMIESHVVNLIMRGSVMLIVFMSLYLTSLFSSPFSGDLRVSSEAFGLISRVIKWRGLISADKKEVPANHENNMPIRNKTQHPSSDDNSSQ
jgi:hypothetical protein